RAERCPPIPHPVIMLKIQNGWRADMNEAEIYEKTRGHWKIGGERPRAPGLDDLVAVPVAGRGTADELRNHHGGVVGPLPGLPVGCTAARGVALGAREGDVGRRVELVGRARCVAAGRAHDGPGGAARLADGDVGRDDLHASAASVAHGSKLPAAVAEFIAAM